MKTLILSTLFMGFSALAMPTIPAGVYQGKASWQDSKGATGRYKVKMKVEGNKFKSTYNYSKKIVVYTFETKTTKAGFFDVLSNGKKVGEGYCMRVQCHYQASFGDVKLEETLTFWGNELFRLGSKVIKGHKTTWEEAMKRQESI